MSYQKWNRSSAFSPEQLATLTELARVTIQHAMARLTAAVDISTLSDNQRAEDVGLIGNAVTSELAAAIEEWWPGSMTQPKK